MMENIYLKKLIQKKEHAKNINKWINQLVNASNFKFDNINFFI